MIVFFSFMCPKLDVDLLPCWTKHYVEYFFDRYVAVLHRVDGDDEQADRAKMILHDAGFEYTEVRGVFNNGELQEHHTDLFRATLDKEDHMVVADSDEFHQMPYSYRELALEYDVISGLMEECWGDTLHEILPGVPLHVQYPHVGDIFTAVRPLIVQGSPEWYFASPKTKILSSKVKMPVSMIGSHCLYPKSPHGTYSHLPDRKVLHYTCRPGYIARIAGKSYVPLWVVAAMAQFFKLGPDSEEGRMVIDKIESRQKLMGWMPAHATAI